MNVQIRLPKHFHEYGTYDNLIRDFRKIESIQLKNIKVKFYYDDLIILYCGNYLKFGRLVKQKKKKGVENI